MHPPQHLREQLIQNGRNNMIMRNVQFQLLQQQLLAQTGVGPLAAAAAAAAAANPTQGTLANNSNSVSNKSVLILSIYMINTWVISKSYLNVW